MHNTKGKSRESIPKEKHRHTLASSFPLSVSVLWSQKLWLKVPLQGTEFYKFRSTIDIMH